MAGKLVLSLLICAGLLMMTCSKDEDNTPTGPGGGGTGAPAITTQPASQTVNEGSSVSLTVVATGDATLTYQWQKDGNDISGATSATYTIASATSANTGTYRVVVTNAKGSVTSNAATLTVNPSTPTAPAIVTQPQSVTASEGGSATFSVIATGNPTPTYQWRKNGNNIAGATNSTYTISSITQTDAGVYSVLITNSQGSVTSSGAVLTVNRGPEVLPYSVSGDTMFIYEPERTETETYCQNDSLVTDYYTNPADTMVFQYSVSASGDTISMDEGGGLMPTLRRLGTGTGLIGTWVPIDPNWDGPDTLVFSATTITAYDNGGNDCPAEDYMQDDWPNLNSNLNGSAQQVSCTQVRITGNVTSEVVTITWDANDNMTYTSSNTARTLHIFYANPTSCPNNWTPDWFYSNDGFVTQNP